MAPVPPICTQSERTLLPKEIEVLLKLNRGSMVQSIAFEILRPKLREFQAVDWSNNLAISELLAR
jgi:hypothetical protein